MNCQRRLQERNRRQIDHFDFIINYNKNQIQIWETKDNGAIRHERAIAFLKEQIAEDEKEREDLKSKDKKQRHTKQGGQ